MNNIYNFSARIIMGKIKYPKLLINSFFKPNLVIIVVINKFNFEYRSRGIDLRRKAKFPRIVLFRWYLYIYKVP